MDYLILSIENGVQIGGNAKYTQLQQLASQTAGESVTSLVQSVVENPNNEGWMNFLCSVCQ